MAVKTHSYNFWFVFQRAEDVPGEWVGHCLELDVVSQGNSLQHAMSMLSEASMMVLKDDLAAGKNPLDRRAPDSCFDLLCKLMKEGTRADFASLSESDVHSVACQVMYLPLRRASQPQDPTQPVLEIPLTLADSTATPSSSC